MPKNPSVFLSHASADKPSVRQLAADLRAAGVDVWLDEAEISVGAPIPKSIQEGLTQSDYLAVWLTRQAVASGWVEREWQAQIFNEIEEGRVIVLPLLAETCEIPTLLRNKRYADFRGNYSAGLADLLRSLRSQRAPSTTEPVRVVILAGGLATRLWPLTRDLPKALLRLAGGTVLQHLLLTLKDLSCVDEILVSVDENKAHYFSDVAGEIDSVLNSRVSLVEHPLVGGSIKGPVAKIRELVDSGRLNTGPTGWNLVIGVDNIFTFSLSDFVSFAQERRVSSNVVIEKHTTPKEFGIARTTGDVLDSVLEKPEMIEEVITKISTACYIYTGDDIVRTREYLDHKGDDNLGSFVAWLCQQSRVLACCFSSEWVDVGTREGILNGNRLLISRTGRQPQLIPGNYQIREPVFIEDGVRIEGSVIGPNVFLGRGCYIQDSEVSNAIVYEGCQIKSCRPFEHIIAGSNSHFEGNIGAAVYGPNTKITTIG
jgi:NDP-sugar pyrophosphorylase family protein